MSDIQNSQKNEQTRYLRFSLGAEEYAIPLLNVKEVIARTQTTPVPHTPSYFLGLMNLRGQIISVIDLGKKLGIKPRESFETVFIICELGEISLGVMVDSVNSVLTPDQSQISTKPDVETGIHPDFITGIYHKDSKLVLFLDVVKALSVEDQLTAQKAV